MQWKALLRASAWTALGALAAWPGALYGQAGCAVEEQQRIATVTGRFSVGASTVALTLPHDLYRAEPSVVYAQVSGEPPKGLMLDSGGKRTDIADGAALALSPKRNQRLAFSVTDANGQRLCEWVTNVGTARRDPPAIADGFGGPMAVYRDKHFKAQSFRGAGDPLVLRVGGKLTRETTEFTIDGAPATVLARNAGYVILRDPSPAPGMRLVQSNGFSLSVPTVAIEMRLDAAARAGLATLEIAVTGRDQLDLPPLRTRQLALYNFNPAGLQILCGRPVNYGDPRLVTLGDRDGKLTASCRVKPLAPGPLRVDASLMEMEIYAPGTRWRLP